MKSSCAKACGWQLTYNGSHHHSFSAVDFSSLTCSGRENSQWASFAFLNCPRYTAWWAGTAEMNLIFPHYKLAFFSLTKIKLTLRRVFDKMWIPLKRTISNRRLKSNTSGYVNKRPCDKMICNTPGTSCGGHNLILTLEDLVLPHCHSALAHAPPPPPTHTSWGYNKPWKAPLPKRTHQIAEMCAVLRLFWSLCFHKDLDLTLIFYRTMTERKTNSMSPFHPWTKPGDQWAIVWSVLPG